MFVKIEFQKNYKNGMKILNYTKKIFMMIMKF